MRQLCVRTNQEEQDCGISAAWESVCFLNTQDGWVVGNHYAGWSSDMAYIINSSNGGADWNIQLADPYDIYNDVCFVDNNNGWAVGYYFINEEYRARILKTVDGGNKWEKIACDSCTKLNAVYFTDTHCGWTVGDLGAIYNTTDGGLNWQQQHSNTDFSLVDVHFTDPLNGWLVGYKTGDGGIIMHTTDGGHTWQSELYNYYFHSIHFSDKQNGLISGSYGLLLLTNDAGNTWEEEDPGTDDDICTAILTDGGNAYAIGQWGTVLFSPALTVSVEETQITTNQNQAEPFNLTVLPNPSSGKVRLRYQILQWADMVPDPPVDGSATGQTQYVILDIYSIEGIMIERLLNEKVMEGEYEMEVDLSNLPAGLYFIILQIDGMKETVKLILTD